MTEEEKYQFNPFILIYLQWLFTSMHLADASMQNYLLYVPLGFRFYQHVHSWESTSWLWSDEQQESHNRKVLEVLEHCPVFDQLF